MLGDRLPGDVEARGDIARGALSLGEQREHLAPARLGEHLEGISGMAQLYTCASACLRYLIALLAWRRRTILPSASGELVGEAGLAEKAMFGGVAFLLDGNMAVGITSTTS